jgi:hypothetical protein
MPAGLIRAMFIAAVAMVYVSVALPLPYLLLDHDVAMQAGDPSHSDVDAHAWLEWVAGSSLSGAGPVLPSALAPSLPVTIPSTHAFSVLLGSALQSRGPPAIV